MSGNANQITLKWEGYAIVGEDNPGEWFTFLAKGEMAMIFNDKKMAFAVRDVIQPKHKEKLHVCKVQCVGGPI